MQLNLPAFLKSDKTSAFMRKYGISIVMLLMIVLLSIATPVFLTESNIINVLLQVSINGILALGMTFVITAGGIDLSIGSLIALTSVSCGAVLVQDPENILGAIALALALSTLFGFINGFVIAKFDMFPFVVTLATQMIIRGVAYVISDGQSYVLASPAFKAIGSGKFLNAIPYPILIFAGVAVIAYILLHNLKFGRYIYATGGNIKAAIASGVNVVWIRIWSFTIMGLCSGIAGIVLSSRVNAGQPNLGIAYETDAIAACVIGGTSLMGGVSTILGTVVGILIIGIINNGMNLMQISSYYQIIVKGMIIIGAVFLDNVMSKKRAS